jgi:hypothetical protein
MRRNMLQTFESAPTTTNSVIDELEQWLGIKLPQSYRQFLLCRNGGRPERDLVAVPTCAANPVARIHFFFGAGDPEKSCDLRWNWMIFADRIPQGVVPIATTEGADKICLNLLNKDGPVVYWDAYSTTSIQLHPVARSFAEFLDMLSADELSPTR